MCYTIVNLTTKEVLSEKGTSWSKSWLRDSKEFSTFDEGESFAQSCIKDRTKTFTGYYGVDVVDYKVIPFAIVQRYAS